MRGRGVVQQLFLDGVAVEACDGAEPPCDCGPRAAGRFEVAGEDLDVGAAGGEQPQLMAVAPGGVLTQVQGAGLAGQAACSRPGTRLRPAAPGRRTPARPGRGQQRGSWWSPGTSRIPLKPD